MILNSTDPLFPTSIPCPVKPPKGFLAVKGKEKDPSFLTCEETVEIVFKERNPSGCKHYKSKSQKKRELNRYIYLEECFRKKNFPSHYNQWDVFGNRLLIGGITFSMSLKEIEKQAQETFENLRKTGVLSYRSEFNRTQDPKKFRTPGVIYSSNQKSTALDRIWGAQYLEHCLKESGRYRVPKFKLVIEDGLTSLPLILWSDGRLLVIDRMADGWGEVLVENIENGEPVGDKPHKELLDYGYRDLLNQGLGDTGNILRRKDKDGEHDYIVDTELKSFDFTDRSGFKKKGVETIKRLREYVLSRFIVFHMKDMPDGHFSRTIKVNLRAIM